MKPKLFKSCQVFLVVTLASSWTLWDTRERLKINVKKLQNCRELWVRKRNNDSQLVKAFNTPGSVAHVASRTTQKVATMSIRSSINPTLNVPGLVTTTWEKLFSHGIQDHLIIPTFLCSNSIIEKTDATFILFQILAMFQRWPELQSNIATTTIASTRREKTRTTYQAGSLSGAPRIGPISPTFVRPHGITCLRKSCTVHQVGDSLTFTAEGATWQIWATTKPQLPHWLIVYKNTAGSIAKPAL